MDRSNLTASDDVGPGILLCMHKNKGGTSLPEKNAQIHSMYTNSFWMNFINSLMIVSLWALSCYPVLNRFCTPKDNFYRTEDVLRVHWSTAHYFFVVKSFRNSGPPSSQQPPITKKSFAAPDLSPRSQKMSRRQKSTVVCLTQIPINDWAVE